MGGIGSGRWIRANAKQTADDLCTLDVNMLMRSDILRAGAAGVLKWSLHGNYVGSISYSVETDGFGNPFVWLDYLWNGNTNFSTRIHLQSTVPHFLGTRWYFSCPMSLERGKCERRVAKLYLLNGHFGCRRCHNLTYRSCQESHQFRRFSDRIGRPLGLPPGRDWDRFHQKITKHRHGRRAVAVGMG